ncbi:FAM3D [Pelobates cultripes]|uniref:FAM3D n=1 Tax=Pelobates cultripes TaxID=61616 RepID=A0AAD1WLV7_PELCU|nr:FAM3D [Pelobates cultripes]
MRWTEVIRIVVILVTLIATWYFAEFVFSKKWKMNNLLDIPQKKELDIKQIKRKCGNEKDCPQYYYAFKIISGAANVVGPSICFEDQILMSGVRNNIGPGINIALINANNGSLLKTANFNMYSGDVKPLIAFIEKLNDGTLLLIASYDDPATKLDTKAREILTSYGSRYAKTLGFRDSWVFVGGKGLKDKSPYEQYLKNEKEKNKYDGWPEVLEMEGCIPQKMS